MGKEWEVEFCGGAEDDVALDGRQHYHLVRNFKRLQEHGWALDGYFFAPVKNSKEGLWEFRVTVPPSTEIRFLFKQEGQTFLMLCGFKKKKKSDLSQARIAKAERRLADWKGTK